MIGWWHCVCVACIGALVLCVIVSTLRAGARPGRVVGWWCASSCYSWGPAPLDTCTLPAIMSSISERAHSPPHLTPPTTHHSPPIPSTQGSPAHSTTLTLTPGLDVVWTCSMAQILLVDLHALLCTTLLGLVPLLDIPFIGSQDSLLPSTLPRRLQPGESEPTLPPTLASSQ